MTISIIGNRREFYCNVVINGENGSVMTQDANGIIRLQGKAITIEDNEPMVKTKITETTEKYDKDGKLVEKITREETTEDNTVYESGSIYYPQVPKIAKGGTVPNDKESKELKITF